MAAIAGHVGDFAFGGSAASPRPSAPPVAPPAWLVHLGFCAPGVLLVVLMQWGDYHGLGGVESRPLTRTSALPVLPTFIGALLALPGLFVTHRTADGLRIRRLFDWRMALIAASFIVGEICNQTAIILAGSLTFTVVYSSVTIWTAIFGMPLLHKIPSKLQWIALVLIVAGLACSVVSHGGATAGTESNTGDVPGSSDGGSWDGGQPRPAGGDRKAFALGTAAGVCGALSYAICYVLTEMVQKADDAPPPEALCVFLGMVGTPVIGLYVVLWDGPAWDYMVADQLDGDVSYRSYVMVYGAVIVLCFAHNLAFFYLTKLSAVMAGINKAVQAVTVFVASHVLYCGRDSNQCLTFGKGVAMVFVVSGVLLFSLAKKTGGSYTKTADGAAAARSRPHLDETVDNVDGGDGFRISNASSFSKLLQPRSPTTAIIVPTASFTNSSVATPLLN
eukprot:SAG11_NODE_1420_length_4956_cov_5.104797_1_plen_447_part_00